MTTGPVRLLVVDDHRMFAESLVHLLERQEDLVVTAAVATAADAIEMAGTDEVDVALIDYSLPDGTGTELTRRFATEHPDMGVVMLTGVAGTAELRAALAAGCAAVVTKDRAAEELVQTIRGVAERTTTRVGRTVPAPPSGAGPLTSRETEVLQLLAEGCGTAAISASLFISSNTARNHVQHVISKLGAHSRLEAVAEGIRLRIIAPPAAGR